MAEVKITNKEELEAWLKDKPREWAVAIAARAALRVVPNWHQYFTQKGGIFLLPEEMVLILFRCSIWARLWIRLPENAIKSEMYRYFPFQTNEFRKISTSALAVSLLIDAIGALDIENSRLISARSSDASVKSSLDVFQNDDFFLVSNIYENNIKKLWSNIEIDADSISNSFSTAIMSHLWQERTGKVGSWTAIGRRDIPEFATQGWVALRQGLAGDNWWVWTDWYEAILDGRAAWGLSHEAGNEIMFEALTWPEEEWKQGPAHVNGRMAQMIEEAIAKNIPLTPAVGDGVDFQWTDGKLTRQARLTATSAPSGSALALLNRIQSRLPRLREMSGKLGNTNPDLAQTLVEYAEVAGRPVDVIDDDLFWASGIAVMAQAAAYERQNVGTTLTAPLEPDQLALLVEVAGLHGGAIMSLPNGTDLSDKASLAKLPRAEIEEPTRLLLARFTESVQLVDRQTRSFLQTQADAISAAGWETASSGYAAYASVRTLIIRAGEMVTAASVLATGAIGTPIIAMIAQHNGWDTSTAIALVDLLRANASPITAFSQTSAEMRAWTRHVLQLLDDDHATRS